MGRSAERRAGFLERHPHPLRSAWRRVFLAVNPLLFPTVHVNEFPKSGGTWLCRMLRDCLGYRFDDNRFPRPGPAVVKHHRLGLAGPRMVVLVRDPRDTLVSYFHHCRDTFTGDAFNSGAVALMARAVFEGCVDRAEAMRRFVETCETAPVSPPFAWREFYGRALAAGAEPVRYEDLRTDPEGELARVLGRLGVTADSTRVAAAAARHDIGRILERRDGEAGHHFVRRGKVGGYADELEPATIALIETRNGELMRRFGYL